MIKKYSAIFVVKQHYHNMEKYGIYNMFCWAHLLLFYSKWVEISSNLCIFFRKKLQVHASRKRWLQFFVNKLTKLSKPRINFRLIVLKCMNQIQVCDMLWDALCALYELHYNFLFLPRVKTYHWMYDPVYTMILCLEHHNQFHCWLVIYLNINHSMC